MLGAGVLAVIYLGGPILRGAEGVAAVTVSPETTASATVSSEISGHATAITGDLIRVDGTLVRIEGVESPAASQPCYRQNGRRWSCASAARLGLSRTIRGRAITCIRTGNDAMGNVRARCTIDGTVDLSTELVRNGYVFATNSLFASLASKEEEARSAKAGIWQGEVARPQEWREQVWDAAKRLAPEGCPIKGVVRASAKIYALPWSDGYAEARVRANRGERWFCSEDEAKAAGFLLSSGS
jgi:endonuclease YncB( thermonuclease family)